MEDAMSLTHPATTRTIELLREADNPNSEDRTRVRASLALKIAAGTAVVAAAGEAAVQAAGSAASTGSTAAGTTLGSGAAVAGATTSVGLFAKIAGVVAVALGLVVGASYFESKPQVRARAVPSASAVSKVVNVPSVATPSVSEPHAIELPAEASVRNAPVLEAPASSRPPKVAAAAPELAKNASAAVEKTGPTLDVAAESALLSAATTALRGRNFNAVFESLDEHARRFPRGVLAEERDTMRIRALAASGDSATACRLAKRFASNFPESSYGNEVRATCTSPELD
jgi:hypothetical protein